MWSPTHVRVTVRRARSLRTKGRGATNDAFVLIQMGKEKFQTSVKEKCIDPEWYEECDLSYHQPNQPLVLVVFHRNLLGIDEFLGETSIPLQDFESSTRTIHKWYPLGGRSGKKDGKQRGEIEVMISFVVHSADTQSLNEFGKKRRNSLKGIATSVSHKLQKLPSRTFSLRAEDFDPRARLAKLREKRNSASNDQNSDTHSTHANDDCESVGDDEFSSSFDDHVVPMKPSRKFNSLYSSTLSLPQSAMITSSIQEDKSLEEKINDTNEDAEETSDSSESSDRNLKTKTKFTSIESKAPPPLTPTREFMPKFSSNLKDLTRSEINLFDLGRNGGQSPREKKGALESLRNTLRRHTLQLSDAPDFSTLKLVPSHKNMADSKKLCDSMSFPKDIPLEVLKQYEKMNRQELILLAIQQQSELEKIREKMSDMESYLDNLLVRVMETTPKILQNPYEPYNPAFSR